MSLRFSRITLFCISFQQKSSSFKKFDVADLEIFFGQGSCTSEKHLVIFTEKGYGMLSKLDVIKMLLKFLSTSFFLTEHLRMFLSVNFEFFRTLLL